MDLRQVSTGGQKSWTKDEILAGVLQFMGEHSRFPKANEFDHCEYLPTARSIQRSFGGLIGLKQELGIADNYHKGEYRSNISRSINKRSLLVEKRLGEFLEAQFGVVCVHRERKISSENKERLDFVVFYRGGEFGIDIFFADNEHNFKTCINVKQKKYKQFKHPLFFISANPKIESKDIARIIDAKNFPLSKQIVVVTEGDFEMRVGSGYERLAVS